MATILLRHHECWCDACFCSCLHEAYDIEKDIKFTISGTQLPGWSGEIIWSNFEPTYAAYIEKVSTDSWDAKKEAENRSLGTRASLYMQQRFPTVPREE